jgi:hypothetical protein
MKTRKPSFFLVKYFLVHLSGGKDNAYESGGCENSLHFYMQQNDRENMFIKGKATWQLKK